MIDYYRTPRTQQSFADKYEQNAEKVTSFADGTKLSMEACILANATGFGVGRLGMYGPACANVREMADLLPPEQMLATGLVDYALGAEPHTGAFVIVHEDSALKKAQLAYYKLGSGPFYVSHAFHLPHVQIALIASVTDHDATIAPLAGPVCEVVAVAKRNLKTGERVDGVGGFCAYGLIDNADAARAKGALPIGLSEGRVLRRDIRKDQVLCLHDLEAAESDLATALPEQSLYGEGIQIGPRAVTVTPNKAATSARLNCKRLFVPEREGDER
jgi:predicted homoserine dehydrogenase-like protein